MDIVLINYSNNHGVTSYLNKMDEFPKTICLGASMLEFDRRIVGNALNAVIQSLHFTVIYILFVRFRIMILCSLNRGAVHLLV